MTRTAMGVTIETAIRRVKAFAGVRPAGGVIFPSAFREAAALLPAPVALGDVPVGPLEARIGSPDAIRPRNSSGVPSPG